MDTKNTVAFFNDDFADLFDDDMIIGEIQNSQDTLASLIKLLEDESNLQQRLVYIQQLVQKFMSTTSIIDVEDKLLQHLLPAAKNLQSDVLKGIYQTLQSPGSEVKTVETLNILQEYLQMSIEVFETLEIILDYIAENESIDMCYIKSVPLFLIEILHMTFQHCKDSENLYKDYLKDLKEILTLFKGAQDVHGKLLKLLEKHVNIDHLEEETTILQHFLEILGEIGEILLDMNVKALADNWKSYMALTQKFADLLNWSSFNIRKPLAFIALQISKNLNNVLNMDPNDLKGSTQVLKICNFFVRVALKLCATFWPNLESNCGDMCTFVLSLYKFYPPFLKFKGYPENKAQQIDSLIFLDADPLLDRLVREQTFLKILQDINANAETPPALLFLVTSLFRRLVTTDENNLRFCEVSSLVHLFFKIANNSYCQFFWKITIPTLTEEQSLYDVNVQNITSVLVSLNQVQYQQVEAFLFRNLLCNSIWCGLLATDIWYSTLKLADANLSYETLCILINKTKPLLLTNAADRPEAVFLANFLQRLFASLPEDYKMLVIDVFPPSLPNIYVWKVLKFGSFPKARVFMIESLLISIVDKIEEFVNRKCDADDFHVLCASLEAIATLPNDSAINIKHLLSVIVNLWNFELRDYLKSSLLFKQFFSKLCKVTGGFILHLSNEQLLLVLTKLKQLLNADYAIKIDTIQILKSLATRSLTHLPEQNQVAGITAELCHTLLLDTNPIVKQYTLEICVYVPNILHKTIVQNAVRNEKQLQRLVFNYIQKNKEDKGTIDIEKYLTLQKEYKFQHKCVDFLSTPRNTEVNNDVTESHLSQKMFKLDRVQIDLVLDRIKNDIELLHKLSGKENMATENIAQIVNILSKQINYKF